MDGHYKNRIVQFNKQRSIFSGDQCLHETFGEKAQHILSRSAVHGLICHVSCVANEIATLQGSLF